MCADPMVVPSQRNVSRSVTATSSVAVFNVPRVSSVRLTAASIPTHVRPSIAKTGFVKGASVSVRTAGRANSAVNLIYVQA